MDNTSRALITELRGLEAVKATIESRIAVIHQQVGDPAGEGDAPAILGVDTLGRVKRKRRQSPELLAKRRESVKVARAAKLEARTRQLAMVGTARGGA